MYKQGIVCIIKLLTYCEFIVLFILRWHFSSKGLKFTKLLLCNMKPVLISHRTDSVISLDY